MLRMLYVISEFLSGRLCRPGTWTGIDPATESTFALRAEAALRTIGDVPKRILVFGCGAGDAAKCFVEHGHHVVGVDLSASGIQGCKNESTCGSLRVD